MRAEHPILFSTPMVQAILAGRKTVTRRIIKESFNGCMTNGGPHPCPNDPVVLYPGEVIESPIEGEKPITVDYPQVRAIFHCSTLDAEAKCPFGKVGDWLWVREAWTNATRMIAYNRSEGFIKYAADCDKGDLKATKWKPSIHIRRADARIWLEVTEIKVEELQDITEEGAIAEGVEKMFFLNGEHTGWRNYTLPKDRNKLLPHLNKQFARQSFESLWSSINGQDSWQQNPWVWAVSVRVLSTTGRP